MIPHNNTYKLTASPSLSHVNQTGDAIASITGTPNHTGVWRLDIQKRTVGAQAYYNLSMLEIEQSNGSAYIVVVPGQVLTTLIPGLTITLGGTLNDGDFSDVIYSQFVPDYV